MVVFGESLFQFGDGRPHGKTIFVQRRSNKQKLQNFQHCAFIFAHLKLIDASMSTAASYIQQQSTRVFHHIFDSSQEEYSLSPVNQSMVVCECNVHHGSWNNVASNHHRAAHYRVHPQDSRLQFQQSIT